MHDDKTSELLTAFADRDVSGLTPDEIDFVQRMVHERTDYCLEYHLNLAIKRCLLKHAHTKCCPASTADSIRAYISLVYQSRRAAL